MGRFIPIALVLFAPMAVAADPPSTVSAEAVEYVRAKPDFAKIYLKVDTKRGDAATSADDHATEVKAAVAALDGLKVKGLKVVPGDGQTVRLDSDARAAGLGAPRNVITSYLNSRTLVATVTSADASELGTAVDKVQQEAVKLGLSGDSPVRALNSFSLTERGTAPTVLYGRKDGWDDITSQAVEKATKRALKKAELLASSAGLKPGAVISVDDGSVAGGAYSRGTARASDEEQAVYQDGELVLKVRVRVVIAATK
jgi:uncharacterized protein YggE